MKRSTGSLDLATDLVRAALVWRRSVTVGCRVEGRNTTYDVSVAPEPVEAGSQPGEGAQ